jgi:hypothetical protein
MAHACTSAQRIPPARRVRRLNHDNLRNRKVPPASIPAVSSMTPQAASLGAQPAPTAIPPGGGSTQGCFASGLPTEAST